MVTLPSPTTASSSAGPAGAVAPAVITALLDALHTEQRLVDDLAATMRSQRTAVGRDDLETVDDTVFATHRILATLGQARLRRRQLGRLVAGSDDIPIRHLCDRTVAFSGAGPSTDALSGACDALLASAAALAEEVGRNRRVLRDALAGGDAQVRTLRGLPPMVAGAAGTVPTLVDRRA